MWRVVTVASSSVPGCILPAASDKLGQLAAQAAGLAPWLTEVQAEGVSDEALRPQGWMARLPPEAQREVISRMLSLQQVSQPLSDASEVAVMELRSADALDPQAFIAALRSSAAAARRQAQLLGQQAQQYDAMVKVIDRWT